LRALEANADVGHRRVAGERDDPFDAALRVRRRRREREARKETDNEQTKPHRDAFLVSGANGLQRRCRCRAHAAAWKSRSRARALSTRGDALSLDDDEDACAIAARRAFAAGAALATAGRSILATTSSQSVLMRMSSILHNCPRAIAIV